MCDDEANSVEVRASSMAIPRHGCWVHEYRELMCSFPTGVTVVTAIAAGGTPRGLTCSSLTSVTLAPPTLLVCLASKSPTLEAVRASGAFAVNLLHARARASAQLFATPGANRFANTVWRAAGPYGLPHLVDDAFAVADCRLASEVLVGDHTIVLGVVEAIDHDADQPLLYGLRGFASWPTSSPPESACAEADA